MSSRIDTTLISDSNHNEGTPSTITPSNFVLLFFFFILTLFDLLCSFLLDCCCGGSLISMFSKVIISLSSTSSISSVLMVIFSKDGALMRPTSNCSVVPGWASDGRLIFTLNLLFLSKTDSTFSMIGTDSVFTVQLNGSGRVEIDMTLPDFAEEELDL